MSFLRVINNILLDIDLLTVMLSPLYSFTPDEIAEIKLENIGVFHNAVINSNSDKVKKFVEEIKMLGRLALTMSVSSFIRYLCEFKNIYAFSNALSNGEQRHANIDKFITFAENFDSSDSYGLASFIRLADKAAKDEHAPDSAELNAAGDNAVIMMSVHRSKGLEFPIVIYAGTARRNVIRDGVSPVLLNQDMGIGLKSHNEEHLYRTDTVPWTVINNKNKIASISENLRVLYVAMTRAKEQFISFITLDDLNKTVDRLEKRITTVSFGPHNSSKLLSDSDYLLTAALMHRDGEILRKYCSTSVAFFETAEFQLDTEIIDSIDDVIVIDETEIAKANMDIVHAIGEKLKFVYPGLPLANIPAMRAASNLNDNDTNLEHFFSSKPAFMDDGVLSPVQRGTAMHEFMHYCDYRNARDDLEEEIERLVKGKYITEEQAVSLNRKALVALFSSAFAKRVFESDKVYREIQLTAFESVNELEGIDFNEKVLVQGIADCVFEEDDELVLIDYKTDNVYNDEQLIDLYRNQLSFYKRALAKTMHKNVKESYLYSFCLNKAIKL